MFLGFAESSIAFIYIMCIASALLCSVYGIVRWNQEDEEKQ